MEFMIVHRKYFGVMLLGLAATWSVGCAGYAGQVEGMRTALAAGDKAGALKHIDEALDLGGPDEYPLKVESDTSLLLLERASVKQASFLFRESSYDFRIADQNVELLDVKNNTVGEISKWIFSGDSGIYRAPAHEKLMLNTLNMLNYLAMSNLESARVEARRFDIMQQYLADSTDDKLNNVGVLGIGDYLAGFTFEMSGRYEQALQYYSAALNVHDYPSLNSVLPELAACTSYRDDDINQRLSVLAAQSDAVMSPVSIDGETAETEPVSTVSVCRHPDRQTGTLLVISSIGLAPHKKATRLPVGAAVVIAGAYLAPQEMAQANDFAVKGLLKWVNFSELVETPSRYSSVSVQVGSAGVPLEYGENLSKVVKESFDETKGKLIAAAIVRMIARAVAGAATNAAVSSGSGKDGLGLLAQVLVEGAMTVADTPDTRCWNALPGNIFISRMEIPAGKHQVTVHFQGASGVNNVTREITVQPGGFAVVPVNQLR